MSRIVLDLVIKGSTYVRNALALAKVVVIRLCLINDVAMLANIAFLWLSVRPK